MPGTYSLSSFSLEERVARDFLCFENPDLVINVVDAANLKRSLHLTVQLLEMECPTVLALNMMDVADKHGIEIDTDSLSQRLSVPVVTTIGRKGEGREALCDIIQAHTADKMMVAEDTHAAAPSTTPDALRNSVRHQHLPYYPALARAIAKLDATLFPLMTKITELPYHWLQIKLLENDARSSASSLNYCQRQSWHR